MKLQYLDVRDPKDIETAFRAASKERADAVLVLSPVLASQRTGCADLAVKSRLPAIYCEVRYVEDGGLNVLRRELLRDLDRRAATYVDKILKGAKPADLPVEQPKKFEFVINLKAAKQIGLTIPPNVLARADQGNQVRSAQMTSGRSNRNRDENKIALGFALCALLFALCFPARAQQTAKIPRIGIVRGDPNAPAPSIKIFQQALQDLGYVEGKNIQFEYRYTEGSKDQAARIVAELVNLKVDILFSTQAIVVHAAKQATKTIPIVMAITPDPVAGRASR